MTPKVHASVSSTSARGDRLHPSRHSRVYWHLTCLRREMESVVTEYVLRRGFDVLVDYGCGNMPYRPIFEPHVGQYVGCDLPGNDVATRIIVHPPSLPVESESADIVLSSQVLEHAGDPRAYLAESCRVLKTGALLVLSTHGVWRYHPDPEDYWRWTSAGLKKELQDAGFNILRFRGIMGPAATGLQMWQDAVLTRVPRIAQRGFLLFMQMLIRYADARCSPEGRDEDACVYLVVAEKR